MQKYQKQMKSEQNLHNWQFQSPNFQKLSNLVPGSLKSKEKSTQGKEKSKIVKISPWVKKFEKITLLPLKIQNCNKRSLEFQYLADLVPGGIILKEKKIIFGP